MALIAIFLIFSLSVFACAEQKAIVENINFDRKSDVVSYELTKSSWVRVRFGAKNGPVHFTSNWQKEDVGNQRREWDASDEAINFNLINNPRCIFSLNYFSENPNDEPLDFKQRLEYDNSSFIGRVPKSLIFSKLYRAHHREFPYDPKVKLIFPDNIRRTEQGLPVIDGVIPIIITLSEKDRKWLRRERFSVQIFIDDVFIAGEAEGYVPYTYNFNLKGINEGKHQLIVNLRGLYDHIGIGEAVVFIKNKDNNP